MKNILKKLIIIFFIFSSFSLYAQKGYFIPNALIEPSHTDAKQLSISVGVFRGLDLHSSYSINNHISVFGTAAVNKGSYNRRWMGDDEFKSHRNDHSFSLGVGYFKVNKNNLHFDNSVGFVFSKTDNFRRYYYSDFGLTGKPESGGYSSIHTNTNYWGAFYQISGVILLDKLEIGLASRFSYNRYTDFYLYSVNNPNHLSVEDFSIFSVEPVGIMSYNFNKYKLSAQGGLSLAPANPKNDIVFVNLIGRLSLQYSFDLGLKNKLNK